MNAPSKIEAAIDRLADDMDRHGIRKCVRRERRRIDKRLALTPVRGDVA